MPQVKTPSGQAAPGPSETYAILKCSPQVLAKFNGPGGAPGAVTRAGHCGPGGLNLPPTPPHVPLVLPRSPAPGSVAAAATGRGSPLSATHLVAAAGEARVPLGQDALHPQEEGALDLVLWREERTEAQDVRPAVRRHVPATANGGRATRDCDGSECHRRASALPWTK